MKRPVPKWIWPVAIVLILIGVFVFVKWDMRHHADKQAKENARQEPARP